jgi:uncharacterized protein (TIGR02246 family)
MAFERDPAVAQVLAAEREWARAHLENDTDALAEMMAEEYTQIAGDGSVLGKEEVLASFWPGVRHWDEATSDEHDVRVYGEAAVVIGRWRGRGVNSGQPFDYSARYVSVWVRRDGRWQMVTDQSTEIDRRRDK